jgi:hypothetical protein
MHISRCRGEGGASLLFALMFVGVFGVFMTTVLFVGSTSLLSAKQLSAERAVSYTADGATDAAIQYLRSNPNCGRAGFAQCAPFQSSLNSQTATTTFTTAGKPLDLDRTVQLATTVSGVSGVGVQATVIIRDGSPLAEPPVDVKSWTYTR